MRMLNEIKEFFDNLLGIGEVKDYSNNGLQVEASEEIKTIAFAVDASQETFEIAVAEKADLLFVHHGLSWGEGMKYFTGINGKRLATLFRNNLSLYAAHLPLDAHEIVGNNAVLASYFPLATKAPAFEYHGVTIGFAGELEREMQLGEAAEVLASNLNISVGDIKIFPGRSETCRRIGFVSGGGSDCVQQCLDLGCDTLVTGELLHQHGVLALDLGVSVIAAGHYATETTGPAAVMNVFANEFQDVECVWIDAPTGL